MAEDAVEIDAKAFVGFYKAVSQIDPELKKALRKELMKQATPIVDDVRQAALAIPASREAGATRKKKGTTLGLRASLAAAAKADFNGTGRGAVLHIRISGTRFNSVSGRENRSLPYYMEGRRKRAWRHPVFGNREVWVQQEKHPFLGVTVMKHKDEFINAVQASVDETLQALDSVIQKIQ
jgi:hypothetical protein